VSDEFDEVLLELQRSYLAEAPERIGELRADVAAFRAGQEGAGASLRIRFHRLAGSGGSYGFPEISEVARGMEHWIAAAPPANDAARLDQAVDRLATLFRRAEARLIVPPPPPVGGERPRAVVMLPASVDAERVTEGLHVAGYDVRVGHRLEDPADSPEAPDLLVIGTAPGEGDPSAVASVWTGRRPRPRAVVLIETLRAVDRMRAISSGVDAVLPVERLVEDLPRYARALARVGPPPALVLLVERDPERAVAVAAVLEAASIRVVRCALAGSVLELLEREPADLVVLATHLSDATGVSVIEQLRGDPRFRMLPIVCLGTGDTAERIEVLRAGADDLLPLPIDPELLLHTVVIRAERGRRLSELLHRDGPTGLLNQATLLAQLDFAVEYARRDGGLLTFLVFDLDRFHEVNERFGHAVGDQVLLHVANVFRSNVRASDVIGRFGGEEFAMVLRGVGQPGASVLAVKLRRILGEQSATTAEGVIIPLHVSVGWSCYPAQGASAGEMVHSAVRAMQREKNEK
jgi:diguanylate cyclase (GGDEF)-like protein